MEMTILEHQLQQAKKKLEETQKETERLRKEVAELRQDKLFAYNHIDLLLSQNPPEENKSTRLEVV